MCKAGTTAPFRFRQDGKWRVDAAPTPATVEARLFLCT